MGLIIGLTGGIGSGKTSVSDRFQALGIDIIDADIASRTVVEPGQPALNAISDKFGADILRDDGNLDRAKLRQIIFSDSHAKHWLEGLLHPLIQQEITRLLAASTSAYCFFVSPLLFESGQNTLCDRVLLVDVPKAVQIERTMARDNNNREQVVAIINQQADRHMRQQQADDILCNDQGLDYLTGEVERLHQYYLSLAATKAQ